MAKKAAGKKGTDTEEKLANTQQASGTAAVRGNQAIAAITMAGGDLWQKIIVYVLYGIISITLIVLIMPPYSADKQLKALLLDVPLLMIAAIFVVVRYKDLAHPSLKPAEEVTPTAKGPETIRLPDVIADRVRRTLIDCRKEAYTFLKSINPDLADEQIRANIFLPEYGPSQHWNDYVLKIRPGLHLKMEEPEIGITLKPGQGVTDEVFRTGVGRTARRLKSSSAARGEWDSVYDITEELASRIHPDLKWIISMPITAQKSRPIGVLNIDGLVHEFKTDDLGDCAAKLTTYPFTVFGFVTGV